MGGNGVHECVWVPDTVVLNKAFVYFVEKNYQLFYHQALCKSGYIPPFCQHEYSKRKETEEINSAAFCRVNQISLFFQLISVVYQIITKFSGLKQQAFIQVMIVCVGRLGWDQQGGSSGPPSCLCGQLHVKG